MQRKKLNETERAIRDMELVRQRMFGASFRQIGRLSGLSKSHAHRLTRDVAIVHGGRRRLDKYGLVRVEGVPSPKRG